MIKPIKQFQTVIKERSKIEQGITWLHQNNPIICYTEGSQAHGEVWIEVIMKHNASVLNENITS